MITWEPVDLGDRGAGPLRHRADHVGRRPPCRPWRRRPRRAGPSRRARRACSENARLGDRPLRGGHHRRLLGGQVRRERIVEFRRIDRELHGRLAAVCRRIVERDQRAVQDAVLRARLDIAQNLAFFGGEGGDVDEADDVLRLFRGVRDHGAAVGVADGDDRTRCLLQHAGDVGGVDRDAAQRIRRRLDLHALRLQSLDHAVPARGVGEGAMHEDDGRRAGAVGCLRHAEFLS